jgi:hypothetical protein
MKLSQRRSKPEGAATSLMVAADILYEQETPGLVFALVQTAGLLLPRGRFLIAGPRARPAPLEELTLRLTDIGYQHVEEMRLGVYFFFLAGRRGAFFAGSANFPLSSAPRNAAPWTTGGLAFLGFLSLDIYTLSEPAPAWIGLFSHHGPIAQDVPTLLAAAQIEQG